MAAPDTRPRILLIGAGHAHLHVARMAQRFARRGIAVTLVDPNHFWYSGLATGMLGGSYEPEEDRLDPAPLIEQAGGQFIRDRLVRLDRPCRRAWLASGESIEYDLVSLNVGSQVPVEKIPGAAEHGWPVKPISNLYRLRRYLETCFPIHCFDHLAIVGGGPTGCEIACNLAELAHRHGDEPRISLLVRGSRILPNQPPGAARFLTRWLKKQGVSVQLETPVERMEERALVTPSGRTAAGLTILATGLRAPTLTRQLDLPLGEDGGLRVNAALRSPGDPRVFGAGDCISFGPRALPKVGVFGVRQAPVLADNLFAAITGQPLRAYEPQKRYLTILNIGRGRGLAIRGRLWAQGRWCMRWKGRLDRRFLAAHRRSDASS